MRRAVLGVLLLSTVLPAPARAAAASRKDCIRACSAQIAACELSCVPFGGGRFGPGGSQMSRACRKAVLKTCRRHGLAVCEGDSTTTTSLPGGSSTRRASRSSR